MKKLKWLVLVMCVVLGLSVFVACGNDNEKDNDTPDPNAPVAATAITLKSAITMEQGDVGSLTAILTPGDANAEITWTSSDPAKVKVSSTRYGVAKLEALAIGTANITASVSGKTAQCTVTVNEHQVVYYYMRGEHTGGLFDWNEVKIAGMEAAGARVLKPAEGASREDETKLSTTIALYAGDSFKFDRVLLDEGEDDQGWKRQIGGSEAEGANITVGTEAVATTLDASAITDKNPPTFSVTADGKYEITLDITDSAAPVVTYKKVDDVAPLVKVSDVKIKGGYHEGWGDPQVCAEGFDVDVEGGLKKTFKIKVTGVAAPTEFGLYSVETGTDTQLDWGPNTVDLEVAEGCTGIVDDVVGQGNWKLSNGVYEIEVTLTKTGKFVKVSVKNATDETGAIMIEGAAA